MSLENVARLTTGYLAVVENLKLSLLLLIYYVRRFFTPVVYLPPPLPQPPRSCRALHINHHLSFWAQ